jgi:uncharacterized protein with von Willebrand factor type A (vWA) domain
VVQSDPEGFYFLARSTLVKDERQFDKFDRGYGNWLRGMPAIDRLVATALPEEWLRREFLRQLSDEDKAKIEALGGLDKLIEEFRKRLAEQQGPAPGRQSLDRHRRYQPIRTLRYNPEGFRIGAGAGQGRAPQGLGTAPLSKPGRHRRARHAQHQTRAASPATLRPRRAQRKNSTSTARSSTPRATRACCTCACGPSATTRSRCCCSWTWADRWTRTCRSATSCSRRVAASSSGSRTSTSTISSTSQVWRDNRRRAQERTPVPELIRTYGPDHKLVFVGDAAMASYEITHAGGSLEHWNEEPGAAWMQRLAAHYPKLDLAQTPTPEERWGYSGSTELVRTLVQNRMFPFTLRGLDDAMRALIR